MKKQADGRQLELSLLMEGSPEDHRHLVAEVPGTTLLLFFFVGVLVFFLFANSYIHHYIGFLGLS